MDDYLHVATTVATHEQATRLAGNAVTEFLAASAQVSGPVTTLDWGPNGYREREGWQVTLKTTRRRYAALESYLLVAHPNTDPEIFAVPLIGPAEYLDRLDRMTLP